MRIGKRQVDSRDLLDRLASGKTQVEAGAEFGYKPHAIHMAIMRLKQSMGVRTTEQAVAVHVAERIRANLPIALQPVVDRVLKR